MSAYGEQGPGVVIPPPDEICEDCGEEVEQCVCDDCLNCGEEMDYCTCNDEDDSDAN